MRGGVIQKQNQKHYVAAEKRVVYRSVWLPWVLMVPQLAVIGVFFFWPAWQTVLQSL